ncbi:hypothetical protein BCON_0083g00360 [Botryotinia convoluta]|uniref:chitinase n=1 Tax=Botryotinia convoluta TaxID=54673 RepID=A0A4Z1IH16_9HELO|nr:hypothetical protein BCON_0083g00360 [Botryotinia convoluta]
MNIEVLLIMAIYGRQFFPQELPVANLTHVLYAFANINPDSGEIYLSDLWADINAPLLGKSSQSSSSNLYGCLQQMYILKKQNRNLKVMLSIGGWTYSSNFPAAASTISKRAAFASSVVSLVQNLGLDGVDIDWEYPSDDTQANNFVLLLQEVRSALDKLGGSLQTPYHFLLTVASSANPAVCQNWQLSEMDQYLDFWNFMAYDFSGSWSSVSAHQANISPSGNGSTPFNTETGISYYIARGIASDKIVLGMPIYGRSFEKTNGIGQSFQGVGQGTWESGVYDYKVLPLLGATEVYDESIGASYSWDTSKKEIISYDNPLVAVQKGKWIQSMNLGGAMWWESSADGRGSRSLIGSVMSVLGSRIQNVTNQLLYPNSTYANIKDGMPGFSSLPLANISNLTIYTSGAHSSSGLDITSSILGTTIAKSSSEVRTTIDSSCSGNAAINSYAGTTTTMDISLPGNTASNPSSGIVTPLRNSSSQITTVSSLLGTATIVQSSQPSILIQYQNL